MRAFKGFGFTGLRVVDLRFRLQGFRVQGMKTWIPIPKRKKVINGHKKGLVFHALISLPCVRSLACSRKGQVQMILFVGVGVYQN